MAYKPIPPRKGRAEPNKFTKSAKEAFRLAFEKMGGAEKLTEWAKANETEFYKLYARLIPTEITGKDGVPLVLSESERMKRIEMLLAKLNG